MTPGRIVALFTLLGLGLIPWTLYLAFTLPRQATTSFYSAPWVGFDIGLSCLVLLTAALARRAHRHTGLAAVAVASMLVVDAWFDVMTSPGGAAGNVLIALASAIFVELPLAILALWLALNVDRLGTSGGKSGVGRSDSTAG